MSSPAREETHFGDQRVPLAEKQGLVDDVFHKVADRYDLMNDLMSAGLHRLWKDALVAKVRPPRNKPFAHLDVAGGTGDVAFRVANRQNSAGRVASIGILRSRSERDIPQIDLVGTRRIAVAGEIDQLARELC